MQEEKIRYYFVDGIRGKFAIINMVIFHFLYDVYIVYEKSPTWDGLPAIQILATGDMLHIHFYLWFCMGMGKRKEFTSNKNNLIFWGC